MIGRNIQLLEAFFVHNCLIRMLSRSYSAHTAAVTTIYGASIALSLELHKIYHIIELLVRELIVFDIWASSVVRRSCGWLRCKAENKVVIK
jgi:hypothetical protein